MNDTATTERCSMDDVIDVYKKDIDRTLIRENLKLTVEERILKLMSYLKLVEAMRAGMKKSTGRSDDRLPGTAEGVD